MNISFDLSTQAKRWTFDTKETLFRCRERCNELGGSEVQSDTKDLKYVRNFASGFNNNEGGNISFSSSDDGHQSKLVMRRCVSDTSLVIPSGISVDEQEIIVRFHANQICRLVGPSAVVPDLRRSSTKVVATAIMIFRRFYLSNSVLDYPPPLIKAASVFLASKVEEERVKIDALADATSYIYRKSKATPLYRKELRAVSVKDIEEAERVLLKGINYDMICFHPNEMIGELATSIYQYLIEYRRFDYRHANTICQDIHARAEAFCYRALVATDTPFLFSPQVIAFAVNFIALRYVHNSCGVYGLSAHEIENFLLQQQLHFSKDHECHMALRKEIDNIVSFLFECPQMELGRSSGCRNQAWNEVQEVWQVLTKVAGMRESQPQPLQEKPRQSNCNKRRRSLEGGNQSQERMSKWARKMCPKVTPISQH